MRSSRALAVSATMAAALALASCDAGGAPSDDVPTDTVIDQFGTVTATEGPNGEQPTPASDLELTEEQIAELENGGYRAAIAWHELSSWSNAIQAGIEDELDRLGVEIVSTTDAKFDAATQANQVQTALSLKPDVILGQAVDPVTANAVYQDAVDQNVKLVFADQAPDDYSYGKEYQSVLTDDLFQIGQRAGNAMCDAVPDGGEIAVLYYDADFHVTNFRDASFLSTIAAECPDVKIVAKEGFSDPNKAEEIANPLLTRHPDLAGVYTSWAVPAQGVLSALKNAGNSTTKIVTVDLDDTIAADMAADGNVAAIVADEAYDYGRAMATAAALAILEEPAPEFAVSDSVSITKDNVADGYEAWNQEVPSAVLDASKQ
ncbi:substrate-binding domain-containing protein [Microbacterium halotolerans]|uniref:substrate-binding domain-containing protein n=1 Tax=Microbacterium halotolerans TaxID=246613 RepID=UPI000E6AE138|nr:substrate-binding domain-containing protein [Microbacterium halotolerans]